MFKQFADVIANVFDPKKDSKVKHIINNEQYYIPRRYKEISYVSRGKFGKVISALNTTNNTRVAIKKIKPFTAEINSESAYMELLCLKKLKNPNVIQLKENFISKNNGTECVYIVTERMDCNLSEYIYYNEKQILSSEIRYIMFQLCNGLKYIHSANLIHRDIKPSNIFINKDYVEVKIGDFGCATIQKRYSMYEHIPYVGSLWYRAPEMIYGDGYYNQGIDMWAVGCIFAELLRGKPLFAVENADQLIQLQCELIGYTDDPRAYDFILDEDVLEQFINTRPITKGKIERIFGRFEPEIVTMMKQLLVLNPFHRTSARNMLTSEYFTKTFWLPPQSLPEAVPLQTSDEPKGKDIKSLRKEMKKKLISVELHLKTFNIIN